MQIFNHTISTCSHLHISLFAILVTVLFQACGSDDGIEASVTPGKDPSGFAAELKNASPRYTDSNHNLLYDNGGIMLRLSETDNISTVLLTDLKTGCEIKLLWHGAMRKGCLNNGLLYINGIPLPDYELLVEELNEKGAWISIHAPNNTKGVLMIAR